MHYVVEKGQVTLFCLLSILEHFSYRKFTEETKRNGLQPENPYLDVTDPRATGSQKIPKNGNVNNFSRKLNEKLNLAFKLISYWGIQRWNQDVKILTAKLSQNNLKGSTVNNFSRKLNGKLKFGI